MNSSHLAMSVDNRFRLIQFSRVKEGHIARSDAAATLGIGNRQFRRAYKTWRENGDASLIHGLCGKPPNRKPNLVLKDAALEAWRTSYKPVGAGPTYAAELMAKDGILVPSSTLRLWLVQAGEWIVGKAVAPPVHRARRERKGRFGQMVQMDGSPHDWFDGRNPLLPKLNLMVMVDDATSTVHARFSPTEDAHAVFCVFREWCLAHGVPESLYVDQASIYLVNRSATVEEEVNGKVPETQYARAMREMGVNIIHARSPQAKGRVERMNQTLQDRLVISLSLAGISDIDAANEFLRKVFLPEHNARFSQAAAEPANAHRKVADCLPSGKMLDDVLVFEETRVVGQDWCLQWNKRVFQVDDQHRLLRLPTRQVVVREKLDGAIAVIHRGKPLVVREHACRPKKPRPTLAERLADHVPPAKPKANHLWRKDGVGKASPQAA